MTAAPTIAIRQILATACLGLLGLLSGPALAQGDAAPAVSPVFNIVAPAPVVLKYKVIGSYKGLTYGADSELAWSHTGGQYEAVSTVKAFLLGTRRASSVGRITPKGLAPSHFSDKTRSDQSADFDEAKGKISFSANSPDAPWIRGTQDRVSIFVQLASMLAGKPSAFGSGSSITLYTVGPTVAENWSFSVHAEETLDLPIGKMQAVKLSRKPRQENDQKLELWLAPSLAYLPVRNRVTMANGDVVDQQLAEVIRH